MKKSIVWLASYPKSGNTWTRIFLANYLTNAKEPVPINQVHKFGMGDSIPKTYRMVGGANVDTMNVNVTLGLRDRVLRGIVANNADVNLVKTHNINKPALGTELIPDQFTRSAIYIIRNPLDMVLSYARHYGMSIDDTIDAIGHSDHVNQPDETTVFQFLGSWSDHVESWTGKSSFPICVLRYEDMLTDPHAAFTKVLENIGVPVDPERLDRAVKHSSFKEVSKQEKKGGFAERSRHSETFFSKGTSDNWKSELTEDQVARVRRVHRKVMKKHGYY
ncbi:MULTISPECIES: sulfotransferase domain-containing protein [unclassified Roseovarius]|uniref:sulfotransferase domain-containing protein n=1 Tax=unclassified Roseovarius TaxID=2614913 RepID=UPI00273F128F|nr:MULTISPECIES: sulfotransferase domain-containing protein [unclassified Roseovarius]